MVQLNCKPSFKHLFLHKLRPFYTFYLKSLTYVLQFGVKCPHVLFKAGWNFWIHRSQNHWQPRDSPMSSGQGVLLVVSQWPWCSAGVHNPAWGCQRLQAFIFHFVSAQGIFLTAEHRLVIIEGSRGRAGLQLSMAREPQAHWCQISSEMGYKSTTAPHSTDDLDWQIVSWVFRISLQEHSQLCRKKKHIILKQCL